MKRVISKALSVLVLLAILDPSASGQMRTQQRSVADTRYRVGLMFATGGTGADGSALTLQGVAPGGPAERAGLQAGDVITHVNGEPSTGKTSDYAHLFRAPEPIELRVVRDADTLNVTLVPEEVASPGRSTASRASAASSPSRPGRIPIGMEFGKPSVRAKINGKGPWTFLVDTGAGTNILNATLVEKLDLPITGKQPIGDPANPEAIKADVIRLDSIALGDITLRDVRAVSWDRSDLYQGAEDPPQGVLGIGLFRDYLLTFDYPAGEIALEQGELPPVDNDEILPYSNDYGGIPQIEIKLAGKKVKAHFDTGSPAPLSLPDSWEKRLKLQGPTRVVGRARTVNTEFEIRAAQLDGDLAIGGHVIEDPQLVFAGVLENTGAANIGSGLLGQFALTFDQKNKRLRLRRPQ